jgi:hypothetical protein
MLPSPRPIVRWTAGLIVLAIAAAPAMAQAGPTPVSPPADHDRRISRSDAQELFRTVDEILSFVSNDSALAIRHSVKKRLINREQVQQYVEKRMTKDKDAQRLQRSEVVLKKFGLLPRTFDLRSFLVALLREQVAGFYDPKTKTVNLLDWVEPDVQRPVLAHELTHALQDQDHRLDQWIRKGPNPQSSGSEDDEQVAARQAAIEGQAMVVLVDFELAPQHQTILDAPNIVEAMEIGMSMGSTLFNQAPIYLKQALTFPYTYGLDFERELLSKAGKEAAFAGVLRNPPTSTRQVMQPETYLARERISPMLQPDYSKLLGRKFARVDQGQIGELDVSILLKQFTATDSARGLWSGWRGGHYYAARQKSSLSGPVSLIYVSRWATPEQANRFAAIYASSLPKKYARVQAIAAARRQEVQKVPGAPGEVKVTIADPVTCWRTSEGMVFVEAHGTDVLVMEGFEPVVAAALRQGTLEAQRTAVAAAR